MATQPEQKKQSSSHVLHSSASFCLEIESEEHTPRFTEWSSSDESVGEPALLRSDSDEILACTFESCLRSNYKEHLPSPPLDPAPASPLPNQLDDTSAVLPEGDPHDERERLNIIPQPLDRISTDLSGYAPSTTGSSSISSYSRDQHRQAPDLRMLKPARKTRTTKWLDEKSKPPPRLYVSESTIKLPASTTRELPSPERRPVFPKHPSNTDVNRSTRPPNAKREGSSQPMVSPGIVTIANPIDYWYNPMTDRPSNNIPSPRTPDVHSGPPGRREQSKSDFTGADHTPSTPVKERPAARPSVFRSISHDFFTRKKAPKVTIQADSAGPKTPNSAKYSRTTLSTPSTISSSHSPSPELETPKPQKKKKGLLARLRRRSGQSTPDAKRQSHEDTHKDSPSKRPKKLMLAPTTMLPMPGTVPIHFLESEATKIITPPTPTNRPKSGYFDFDFDHRSWAGEASDSDKSWSRAIQTLPESPGYRHSYNEVHGPRTAPAAPLTTPDWFRVKSDGDAALEEKDSALGRFEWDVPEHLPNSPLCPMHLKHPSGGRGVCVYHGRRKSKFSEMALAAEASVPGKKSISWTKTEKLLGLALP